MSISNAKRICKLVIVVVPYITLKYHFFLILKKWLNINVIKCVLLSENLKRLIFPTSREILNIRYFMD